MNFASLFAKPLTLLPSRLPSCDNTTTPIRVVVATLRPFCLNVLQNVHVDFLFNFVFDFHYSTPLYTPPPIPSAPPLAHTNHAHSHSTHTHTHASLASPCLVLPHRHRHRHCANHIRPHWSTHTATLPHCHTATYNTGPHTPTPATLPHATLQLKSPKLTKQNCVRMDKLVNYQCCHARRAPRSSCRWRRRKWSISLPQTLRLSLSTPIE